MDRKHAPAKRKTQTTEQRAAAGFPFPREWTVFGPVGQDAPEPEFAGMTVVPKELAVAGKRLAGQKAAFTDHRLDLGALLGGQEVGKTAYLLAVIEMDKATEVELGAGADWWMKWQVNGEVVCDTTATGNNGRTPSISILDHRFTAQLKAGRNLIAVRVISGRASFVVAAGESQDFAGESARLQAIEEEWLRKMLAIKEEWLRKIKSECLDAAPKLLPAVEIAGTSWELDRLPQGLKLDRDLGVVVAAPIGKAQAVGPYYPYGSVYSPRAVKAPNGDYLLMVVYGGYYQHTPNNAPVIWRSTDQGRTWDRGVRPWTQDAGEHCLVPLVDPSQSGRIYVFGNASRGRTHATDMVFRRSDDNGHTWSAPTTIVPQNDPTFPGGPIHMRGAVMPDGAWLWGAYYRDKGNNDTQYLLRSTDRGQTWTIAPNPHPQGWTHPTWNKFMESTVVPIGGPEAVFYLRAPGGRMYEKRTTDSGLTWSETQETPGLVHPDAPPMVFPFAGGKRLIAFIHNRYNAEHPHHYHPDRNALWFAVSDNAGRSWGEPRFIIAQAKQPEHSQETSCDYDVSYVDLLVDGCTLHLFVGDQQRRSLHLAFSEQDLASFPTGEDLHTWMN